jgi:hypothetical protein
MPEQLDVDWFGPPAGKRLPVALPVENQSESIRIFRIFEKSVPHRAQSFRPAFAGDLAVSGSHCGLSQRCSGDIRASFGGRDRGQAVHRSAWLAADEQPLFWLAGDAEQAERLGPAIDVDPGVDQKVVTKD